jgi:hypothetical protein
VHRLCIVRNPSHNESLSDGRTFNLLNQASDCIVCIDTIVGSVAKATKRAVNINQGELCRAFRLAAEGLKTTCNVIRGRHLENCPATLIR